MKKSVWQAILIAVVLFASSVTAMASPPQEAADKAREGLGTVQELVKDPSVWGMTTETLKGLTISGGYQVVTYDQKNASPGKRAEQMKPLANDTWLFFASDNALPVLFLQVANTPEGWRMVHVARVPEPVGRSLQDGVSALKNEGYPAADRIEYLTHKGIGFWRFRIGNESLLYPTAEERSPLGRELGLSRSKTAKAEALLRKLETVAIDVGPEEGGGGGVAPNFWMTTLLPIFAAVALVVGVLAWRRRVQSHG